MPCVFATSALPWVPSLSVGDSTALGVLSGFAVVSLWLLREGGAAGRDRRDGRRRCAGCRRPTRPGALGRGAAWKPARPACTPTSHEALKNDAAVFLLVGNRLHGPQILALLAVSGLALGLLIGLAASGRR